MMPKDTQVVGHVTVAQIRNKEQKESQVGIAFDHAVMKTGDEYCSLRRCRYKR